MRKSRRIALNLFPREKSRANSFRRLIFPREPPREIVMAYDLDGKSGQEQKVSWDRYMRILSRTCARQKGDGINPATELPCNISLLIPLIKYTRWRGIESSGDPIGLRFASRKIVMRNR